MTMLESWLTWESNLECLFRRGNGTKPPLSLHPDPCFQLTGEEFCPQLAEASVPTDMGSGSIFNFFQMLLLRLIQLPGCSTTNGIAWQVQTLPIWHRMQSQSKRLKIFERRTNTIWTFGLLSKAGSSYERCVLYSVSFPNGTLFPT